ncbi:amidase [Alkalicoccobacillus murimartini]|uniref:Amidase n=1 Tax=Alkalicoccobacillus murimartini TaxID=171685 RepID=A0ABT9YFI1_9BACI|nr:amidase [Alkalicoccobacillus murimartini]MDQ0205829.1 amidase [Alkalicoccobacillus murimartini]
MSQLRAYMDQSVLVKPTSNGELDKLTFAVKDVFNLKGVISSAGNPDWLRTHKPSFAHAEAIDLLLNQGATLKGTTHTDELMYSLNGENAHYGTPLNPRMPGHIPGGSSSGSASVAAAGDVDFSIGTDTGGSIRIPAAYCGIYGFRPTHGAVPIDGVIPLAPSFDTVGWMAQDVGILERVGHALLPSQQKSDREFHCVLFPDDAWTLADQKSVEHLLPTKINLEKGMNDSETILLSAEGLTKWKETFRIAQAYEVWAAHGEWVETNQPSFGPGIAERFAMAKTMTKEMYNQALVEMSTVQKKMEALLSEVTVMVIPTVPGPAPKLGLPDEQIEQRRSQTLQLSCIAGLAGLPQVTIPVQTSDGPIGLSIIAGPNQDLRLLKFVRQLITEKLFV